MKVFGILLSTLVLAVGCAHKEAALPPPEERKPADISRVVSLDLVCVAAGKPKVRVMSSPHGAAIHIGSKMFSLERPLSAGTEGGDPYIQHVDNRAYNILLAGDDLTTAFRNNSSVEGNVEMTLQLFVGQEFSKPLNYRASCIGQISFK